jgi:penicillin-binding protein 1A
VNEPKPRRRIALARLAGLLLVGVCGLAAGLLYYGYREFSRDLPQRLDVLTNYQPQRASRVYSKDGELIGEFYLERRVVVPFQTIPAHVVHAFVAAEDNRFYEHGGVDPVGIARAAWTNMRAGHVVQGGSTITQQVAKLLLVGQERSMFRKIREALLSRRIEKELTKDQILNIYLNQIYLGQGAYGVQAAAETYFGKDVGQLTLGEAALLAGLPKAPTRFSPFHDYARARARQAYALDRMVELKFTSAREAEVAKQEPLALISKEAPLRRIAAPYYVEYVRKLVAARYGGRDLFDRGLRIYTTLDMRKQRAAEAAVRSGLDDLSRRLAFRGPVGHLEGEARKLFETAPPKPWSPPKPAAGAKDDGEGFDYNPEAGDRDQAYLGMIDSLGAKPIARIGTARVPIAELDANRLKAWHGEKGKRAEIKPGDLVPMRLKQDKTGEGTKRETVRQVAILAQQPDVQAALVALEVPSGDLSAMVGGYDFEASQFNRAVQAHRQIGSAIKPFIYGAALAKGYTELSVLVDHPVSFKTAAGVWSPKNYKKEFKGPLTLKLALAHSINTISAQLVAAMGVDPVIEFMRTMGLASPIPRHISIALGTPDLTPMEEAYAVATYPAGGVEVQPRVILKVVDSEGQVLEDETRLGEPKRKIPADLAYVMVDMMKGVVAYGTGKGAQALGRPAAGKTGTSTNFRDAWFVGYTPETLCTVWVGRDDFTPIGHDTTGGQTALPIWLSYMRVALEGQPVRDFTPPPSVVFVRASPERGTPATPGTPGSVLVPFRRGTLPGAFASAAKAAGFGDDVF